MEKLKQNKILILILVVLIIVLLGVFFVFSGKNQKTSDNSNQLTPTEAAIPTVDSSVKVTLQPTNGNKEVILNISGIPTGTTAVDYEFSYQAAQQGLQGVFGSINLKNNESEYNKKITLGTCSSGTCVYHQVVGKINVSLKFTGNYGEKIYQKDFEI